MLLGLALAPIARAGTTATAHVGPQTSLFGDTLTATVRVHGDSAHVDVDFAPYAPTREPRVRRSGGTTTYDYAISCLAFACLPKKQVPFVLQLKPVRVFGGGHLVATAHWNTVTVRTRLSAGDVPRANPFVSDATSLAMPRFRDRIVLGRAFVHGPNRVRLALWLAALLAVAAGLALLSPEARRAFRVVVPAPSSLRRAITWTREAGAAGDVRARRRALQALSEALAALGARAVAGRVGEAAWRRTEPTGATVAALADEAELLDQRQS